MGAVSKVERKHDKRKAVKTATLRIKCAEMNALLNKAQTQQITIILEKVNYKISQNHSVLRFDDLFEVYLSLYASITVYNIYHT